MSAAEDCEDLRELKICRYYYCVDHLVF